MPIPWWLRAAALIVLINCAAVGWSIVHRHARATEDSVENRLGALGDGSNPGVDQPTGAVDRGMAESAAANEAQDKTIQAPELPSPEILKAQSSQVSPDDPLLKEIRRQAALQFPNLNQAAETDPPSSTPETAENQRDASPAVLQKDRWDGMQLNRKDLELIQKRLETVQRLNEAASMMIEIALEQQQDGQIAEASATLSRMQQIKVVMIEILSE